MYTKQMAEPEVNFRYQKYKDRLIAFYAMCDQSGAAKSGTYCILYNIPIFIHTGGTTTVAGAWTARGVAGTARA